MINKEKIILSGKFAFYVGGIQTISTYASAEVTSAVVKLFKKYRNTRFLLQIILFFSSADRKD